MTDGSGGGVVVLVKDAVGAYGERIATAHLVAAGMVILELMQGALAEMRAPVTADRLQPFVEPSLCVAQLAEAGHG